MYFVKYNFCHSAYIGHIIDFAPYVLLIRVAWQISPKFSNLIGGYLVSYMVSESEESGGSSVGWFWLRVSHKVPVNTLVVMQSFDSSAEAEVYFQDGSSLWLSAGGSSSSLCGPLHWSCSWREGLHSNRRRQKQKPCSVWWPGPQQWHPPFCCIPLVPHQPWYNKGGAWTRACPQEADYTA